MAIGYGFYETGLAVPVSIVMLVNGVVPIDISSGQTEIHIPLVAIKAVLYRG